ncbi:hypothetical protein, partial [Escherichia coli]|uniref:hypothetical protein n=1 Tax=Escherichia coli TaxID=562 RepID=UPI0019551C7E
VTCSAPAYRLANTSNLLIRLSYKGASAPFSLVNKVRFVCFGCIDSLEVRKKPGGHWIIRDLMGLDLVGLASL